MEIDLRGRSFRKLHLSLEVIVWERALRFHYKTKYEPTPVGQRDIKEFEDMLTKLRSENANRELEERSELYFTDSEDEDKDEAGRGYEKVVSALPWKLGERSPRPTPPRRSNPIFAKCRYIHHPILNYAFYLRDRLKPIMEETEASMEAYNKGSNGAYSGNLGTLTNKGGPVLLWDLQFYMPDLPEKQRNCIVTYNLPKNYYSLIKEFHELGVVLAVDHCVVTTSTRRKPFIYAFIWFANHLQAKRAVLCMHNKRVLDKSTNRWRRIRCWRLYDFEVDVGQSDDNEPPPGFEGFAI